MAKENDTLCGPENWPQPSSPDSWQDYIHDDYIECMICGYRGKLLTEPHLRAHGGSKRLYHIHFHIPSTVRLASRKLVAERRESMLNGGNLKARKGRQSEAPAERTDDLASLLGFEDGKMNYSDLDQAILEGGRKGGVEFDF